MTKTFVIERDDGTTVEARGDVLYHFTDGYVVIELDNDKRVSECVTIWPWVKSVSVLENVID